MLRLPKKLKVKMQDVKKWLRENMHEEKCRLVKRLNSKLAGHFRYYGITGNGKKLSYFRYYVSVQLFKMLNRRSQRKMDWETYDRFLKYNPLAPARIYHSLLST